MGWGRTDRVVRWIERGLAGVGVTCLIWAGTSSLSAVFYQIEQSLSLDRLAPSLERSEGDEVPSAGGTPVEASVPIGRLEIPRIGLSAIVAEGDDEATLNVAVGHLPDTPLPWHEGNSALAGHRDSFFRPLRRIQIGDDIRFATRHGIFRYRVTRHTIVDPDELWVLDASPTATLTLITCYPFDFVGPAPRRFVVRAERLANADDSPPTSAASPPPEPSTPNTWNGTLSLSVVGEKS